jgi:C4-dicarboxylate transporter DctM subunit
VDTLQIGGLAILAFLVLAAIGLPLAFCFTLVGFVGLIFLRSPASAMALVGESPYAAVASYMLACIPMFVLMGEFAFYSGISKDLFKAADRWVGKLPGGLGYATMLACTAFAACTGSSVASAATMGAVAFPEMERYHYDRGLSTGIIAAGGTLGILIPPSTIFIILGIITEQSIGTLFIAGVMPGLMLASLFLVLIFIQIRINPRLGPASAESYTWGERIKSLSGIWGMLFLFILVLGGLYFGIFAPSEAGVIGAAGAFVLAVVKRTSRKNHLKAVTETAITTAYILFIMVGAVIFNTFMAIAGLASTFQHLILSFNWPPYMVIAVILLIYIPLGMFLDPLGCVLLSVPVFFPLVVSLGFDPIWFLVLVCVMVELGLITPPVAINVFVVQGVTKVPMEEVFRGILPFVVIFVIGVIILVAFPQISLWLPGTM